MHRHQHPGKGIRVAEGRIERCGLLGSRAVDRHRIQHHAAAHNAPPPRVTQDESIPDLDRKGAAQPSHRIAVVEPADARRHGGRAQVNVVVVAIRDLVARPGRVE